MKFPVISTGSRSLAEGKTVRISEEKSEGIVKIFVECRSTVPGGRKPAPGPSAAGK